MHSLIHCEDYINQSARFWVDEGFGCTNRQDDSILAILTVRSWTVLAPLTSIILYYRALFSHYIQRFLLKVVLTMSQQG